MTITLECRDLLSTCDLVHHKGIKRGGKVDHYCSASDELLLFYFSCVTLA